MKDHIGKVVNQPHFHFLKSVEKQVGNQIGTVEKQTNTEQGEVNLQLKIACLYTQRGGSNFIEKIWCGVLANFENVEQSVLPKYKNIKVKKSTIDETQKKTKAKDKKLLSVISCRINGMCTGKKKQQKVKIHKKQTKLHYQNYWNSQPYVLDKQNVTKIHNCASFLCKRCFLIFQLKVKVAEDLIEAGTTFSDPPMLGNNFLKKS